MTIDNTWFEEGFADTQFMAIFRALGTPQTLELAHGAWDAGIRLVEVPVQRPEDLETLAALVRQAGPDRAVGAGTVRTLGQLRTAAEAGARFIVAPGFSPSIVEAASHLGLPALPGVSTASEVDAALQLGLRWLKAFPAIALGSAWIQQMAGPFPEARFVATGGMNLNNADEFLAAGARGIAIGSAVREVSLRSAAIESGA